MGRGNLQLYATLSTVNEPSEMYDVRCESDSVSDELGMSALGTVMVELRLATWRGPNGTSAGFGGVTTSDGGEDGAEFKFREASTGGFVGRDVGSSPSRR